MYRSGSQFAFWRWKLHPESAHIDRLIVLLTPLFSLCVHWLNAPDPEEYYHDHPVSFLSLILRGWYAEVRPNGYHVRRWFNLVHARDRHSVVEVASGGAVTICLMGPRVQTWGFFTPIGFMPWSEYYARKTA